MAGSTPDDANAFNRSVIEEFRANEGHVSGFSARTPIMLVHHIGARSGIERITPIGCFPLGDDRYVIVASSGGSPTHPDWYHNLKAHPRIDVEVGTQAFTVLADELDARARARLWPKLVADAPDLGKHATKTARQFPVFLLTRQE
ncbi:MAG TPA: nitroreductase family deazaflavin-dependent oxidoreductase [Acidimicrobiales bacterium]|jgi:deazaflavin-dependent oxidoreductase (nitroreductase family)|nr:nitroreductase family deazaflavin-dependent oxidoreductase [Acidimicrobiales bacterium]HZO66821.1 nitroreductase family deazaflavin-dependent oxidoreductase [Kribbellaceae bacterium]